MKLFLLVMLSVGLTLNQTVAQSTHLESAPDPAGTILIEDDDSAVETTFDGKSSPPHPSLTASGGTVMGFARAKQAGDGSMKVTISPSIPKSGWYQIWMRWTVFLPTVAQHADNVPVTIKSKSGEMNFKINQQSGNKWALLGTYELESGQRPVISFSNNGTTQGANWDAVKLIPVAKPAARPAPRALPGNDGIAKLARNITASEVAQVYGRGDLETDPNAIQLAAANELRARLAWDLMLDTPAEKTNTNWSETHNSGSFMLTREAGLLKRMAVAYVGASNHLGMDLKGNPELLKATLRGMENFSKRYNTTTKWDVNWWDFELGVPMNLFPGLIVLGDAVPQEVRDNFVAAATRFNTDPRKFYNNASVSTGANRLWACQAAMCRGVIAKDQPLLDVVNESVMEPLEFVQRDEPPEKGKKKKSDGFYEDGSFIQHDGIPYVAAYGYLLLESYGKIAQNLKDTPWELKGPSADNAFRIMEICFDPFVVRGETVQNVVGRSLGSKNYEGNENAANFVVTASKLLPFANPEQATRLRALIKKWIMEEPTGTLLNIAKNTADAANPVSATVLADIVKDPATSPLPARRAFEMFANMDVATHRTGDFALSLGMNSQRSLTYESIWGANVRGWFQSEGLLLLYSPDIERYRDGYFRVVDPYRFPGTTVERLQRSEAKTGGGNPGKFGGGDFVGGVALNGNGLAAMHLKQAEGTLEARKAWFFFNDQIVCLGAGIGANGENTVETTVENARIISDQQKLLVDGRHATDAATTWPDAKWAWFGGSRPGTDIGWIFLEGNPPLNTLIETRQGERSGVALSMKFATLWFDHGKDQQNGTYAYVIVPGRSAEQVKTLAEKTSIRILTNTPEAQAVADPANGITGIVGWSPGEVEKISFDEPLAIMVQDQAGKISVAVSDPTMKLTTPVQIRFPYPVRSVSSPNDRITVTSRSPLTIDFDPEGANGQSQRVEFEK